MTAQDGAAGSGDVFVSFQDVWLAYNEDLLAQGQYAVEAIDLAVAQGEFIAIVGPSGCGKSTFMKLATGLKMPSRGRILIDGRPVTGPLKISGMAFQAPSLLPWRTTVDNVLLPLEIVEPYRSSFKARRGEYEQRARKMLQKVGLGGYEDKFPGNSRAACSSAPASAARSSTSPRCCCWTSRSVRSTPSPAKSCGASCATSGKSIAST